MTHTIATPDHRLTAAAVFPGAADTTVHAGETDAEITPGIKVNIGLDPPTHLATQGTRERIHNQGRQAKAPLLAGGAYRQNNQGQTYQGKEKDQACQGFALHFLPDLVELEKQRQGHQVPEQGKTPQPPVGAAGVRGDAIVCPGFNVQPGLFCGHTKKHSTGAARFLGLY